MTDPPMGGSNSERADASSLAGGADGGAPTAGEGGAAGASEQEPILVDGCADLNGDEISDCTETLAHNAEFASDVTSWVAPATTDDSFSTDLEWDAMNAWGTGSSGSAKISVTGSLDFNGASLRGATQCVAVGALQVVVLYANTRLETDQDPGGSAEVDVSFFDTADCSGVATTSFSTPQPPDAKFGTWLTVHAGALTTVNTKSALITLGVVKPFRVQSLTARFDNILVQMQAPVQSP